MAGIERDRQVGVGDSLTVDGGEQLVDVRAAGALHALALARLVPRLRLVAVREQAILDALERVARQFDAVAADELDAVVRGWIVTRGNHHDGNPLPFGVRLRSGRGGDAESVYVAADGGQSAGGGVGEHPPGAAGVACNGDRLGTERGAGGLGDATDERRRDGFPDDAANPTRPEDIHGDCFRGRDKVGIGPKRHGFVGSGDRSSMSADEDISLEEKRVYAGGSARPAFVATDAGLARVSVSGDLVGEFGLAVRESATDVATADGRVVAATDEVRQLTDDGSQALGFAGANVVGFADGIVAAGDGRLARYDDEAWTTLAEIEGATAIGDGIVATESGVVGFGGESRGLDSVRDVTGEYAATADGLYRGPDWEQIREGSFRAVATYESRLLAVTDSGSLLDHDDGEWRDLDAPGAVADAALTADGIYAITTDGTFLADAGDGWRSRVLGLPGAHRLAVPTARTE